MVGGGNTSSTKDRMFSNYDSGGGGVCGFFSDLYFWGFWGEGTGGLRYFAVEVFLFVLVGWLCFVFFCMLLQKHVYEMNVCREVHFQSHGGIKCF